MKKTFAKDIQERDWVETPFLVREKITAMAKNGKPYLTLKLMDRSGEVEGRVWDRVEEFSAGFEKDDFVLVKGKASVYLGKMQLVVQELVRVSDEKVDIGDYLPVAERKPEEMVADLRSRVDSLRDPYLKGLMKAFVEDGEFLADYQTAPAAKTMHHVYLGGLLEHSLAVADLAEDICRRYPGLNRDLLVTGALLHDVGKVAELSYERAFDYTDEGKLLGHIVMGVELVEEKIRQVPGFPPLTRTLLKHLLLSHHGQYEFGSPKRPKTLEAVILNFLDDLDSKINGVRRHLDREVGREGSWTSYHRLYDRYFFREPQGGEPLEQDAPKGADPLPAPAPAKREAAPSAAKEQERKGKFGFSLADQLRGKSLDLFSAGEDEERRHED